MKKHTLLTHTDCTLHNCNICDGGLSFCIVCKGAEGSLPTDCPGKKMTESQESMVYSGKLDYVKKKQVG